MVVAESEMNSQNEVESQHNINNNNNKNNPFSSLGRQSSIYSLTLDEFQHTLWENGKNFGSMNMDEFLSSIWSAEENQVLNSNNNMNNLNLESSTTERGVIRKQPSLPRQGSLTLPAPLCRKTVEEVWSEIHKGQQSQQQHQQQYQKKNNNSGGAASNNIDPNTESAPRQPTFGEMTLEDFLVKAGVVREQCGIMAGMPVQASSHQHVQQYGMYPSSNPAVGPSFVGRPVMGMAGAVGGAGGNVVAPPYQPVPQGAAIGESSGYAVNGKRDVAYPPPAAVPPGVCFGGRVVNGAGAGGYAAVSNMGMVAPVSPVSPEGIGTGENSGGHQFGMDMSVLRGRKRVLDGPVEKVVERRQRRMIKNRESAARSRARKQAYTVELEAELNQLKEENTQLKLALADLERRRKQQNLEEGNGRVQSNAQKAKKKLRSLRKTLSCPL